MTPVFFDTEFTSLLDPHLLSIGLVTLDGRELYAELDLKSDLGIERWAMTPYEVRDNVIEDKWGLFPDSVCGCEREIGLRVGEWLLQIAASDSAGRVALMYDYSTDLELLVGALTESSLMDRVRLVAGDLNIANETGWIGAELASEATFKALKHRSPPLYRHHALADALALRAAWRTRRLVDERSADLLQLLRLVGEKHEGRLYEWLSTSSPELGEQLPLDVLDRKDGLQMVLSALEDAKGDFA